MPYDVHQVYETPDSTQVEVKLGKKKVKKRDLVTVSVQQLRYSESYQLMNSFQLHSTTFLSVL